MIKHGHRFFEKRVSIENNSICFDSGYKKKHFYFFLFLLFVGLLCWGNLFYFAIFSKSKKLFLIFFWVISFLYAIHIPLIPIIEMMFRNRISIKFNENEIIIINVFNKKESIPIGNCNKLTFKKKRYFYYKLFFYKIVLKGENIDITVIDHLSRKKEASSLCDFLQKHINNIEGEL